MKNWSAPPTRLASQGIDASTVVCDLSKPEQVPELVDAVVDRYGTIDILVNNAGTSWGAPAEQMPLEAWDKVMRLNVGSVFQLSQAVANRCFIPRRSGNIINHRLGRGAAHQRAHENGGLLRFQGCGAAFDARTRRGMGFLRHSRQCDLPGLLSLKDVQRLAREGRVLGVIAQTPLGRLGGDADLMGAAVYLASAASSHVTGQYICVDGGASIA